MLRSHWSLVVLLGCVGLIPRAGHAEEPPTQDQAQTEVKAPLVFDLPAIDRLRAALAMQSVAFI